MANNIENLKREARIKNQYIEGLIEVVEYLNNKIEYCEIIDYDENGHCLRDKDDNVIRHAPNEEEHFYEYYRYVAYKEIRDKISELLGKELK